MTSSGTNSAHPPVILAVDDDRPWSRRNSPTTCPASAEPAARPRRHDVPHDRHREAHRGRAGAGRRDGRRRALDPPVGRPALPVRPRAALARAPRRALDPRGRAAAAAHPAHAAAPGRHLDAESVAWSDEVGPERALTHVLDGVRRLLVEPGLPTGTAFLMQACAPGLEIDLDPGSSPGCASASPRRRSPRCAKPGGSRTRWSRGPPSSRSTGSRSAGSRPHAGALPRAGHPPHPDFIVATGPHAALPHHETGAAPIDPPRRCC